VEGPVADCWSCSMIVTQKGTYGQRTGDVGEAAKQGGGVRDLGQLPEEARGLWLIGSRAARKGSTKQSTPSNRDTERAEARLQ
jgi:hypothetical protein